MLDRFDCYELCVQSPRHVAAFLRGLVQGCGPGPVLGEDFCGTAAVSRRWAADAARLGEPAHAVAIDLDAETLAKARALAAADNAPISLLQADLLSSPSAGDAATTRLADVEWGNDRGTPFGHHGIEGAAREHSTRRREKAHPPTPHTHSHARPLPGPLALPPVHAIFVGNFSLGYIHDRATLVSYLTRSRQRLDAANQGFGCDGAGAFVCDLYGGNGAFRLGSLQRKHPSRGREIIHYHWEHEDADPVTGLVTNAISFRVELDGEIVAELPRAFVYRWRLWGLPELREAMLEAGFRAVEVYKDVNVAPGETPGHLPQPTALKDLADTDGDWIVLVAGRA